MNNQYQELLQATMDHLEELKREGNRYVALDPARLAELSGKKAAEPVAKASRTPVAAAAPSRLVVSAAAPASSLVPVSTAPAYATSELSGDEKRAAMDALRVKAECCVLCPSLAASRTKVVFGVGDFLSPLLFVGEAPGAEEDKVGEPFVGQAGELLTKIIQAMGFSRQTIYIANVLKCRPDTPGQSAGNRKPTAQEMQTCLPYLQEQIEIMRPRVLVALGATALEGLFGKTALGITKLRGTWMEYRGIPVMPTYHPAYLLRNQLISVKREVWEDMLKVLERLGSPISEKQRGYFKGGG